VGAAARRLRLPRAAWTRLEKAATPLRLEGNAARAARRLIYEAGPEAARDRALKASDLKASQAVLDVLRLWTPPSMPVGGREVARAGVPFGPETGAVLKAFETQWIADDFPSGNLAERLADAVTRVRGSGR
jgi:poly(A) polymerase